MKHLTALMLCITIFSHAIKAQDLHFSQFFEAPLLRNPSLAGIYTGDIRVQAVYRNQWNSITDAYKTTSLNAEYKMPVGKGNDFLTTGFQVLYDQAGTVSWKTTHLMPAINYHKSLSNDINRYLSVGFMGGIVQQSIDRSKLITNTTYDGGGDGENFPSPKSSYFDAAVGMSFNTQLNSNINNNMVIGVAYHHFNHPKRSFYNDASAEVNPKMVFSAALKFAVTEASYLTIQGDYSKQQTFQETIAGVMYGMKLGEDLDKPKYTLHGGAMIRVNDAIIPVIKLDYTPFSVTLSYDVTISGLKTSSMGRGGFEIGLSYIAFRTRKEALPKEAFCPRL